MLVGYFDESGTSDKDPIVLVGGAVADSILWSRIEVRWREKLAEFGLSSYHAVDCENRWGEFQKFERGIREALTNYFSALLSEVEGQGFGSAVVRKDWRDWAPDAVRQRCNDDPFYFSLELCFQQISRWSVEHVGGEPVALVFAEHQQYSPRIESIHRAYQNARERWPGIGSISFAKPELVVEIQAADLLCYEMFRFANRPEDPQRKTWQNIERGSGNLALSYLFHDAETLQQLAPKQ